MRSSRFFALALSAVAIALLAIAARAPVARADVIKTKDGRTIEGEIVEETADAIRIKLKLGIITLERKDVLLVEKRILPREEYETRLRALDPEDADGRVELARFCVEKAMPDEAAKLLLEVITRKPAQRKARAALDELDWHEMPDGRWLPPDEYYPLIGWLKRKGRWVSPEEADLIDASEDRAEAKKKLDKLEREQRGLPKDLEDAKEAVAKAERRVTDAETKLAQADGLIAGIEGQIPGLRSDIRVADARVAEAEASLRAIRLIPPPPGEDELSRAARLAREREIELLFIQADNDARRARQALASAERDLAELRAFKAQGPAVLKEREAAVDATRAALDELEAKARALEGEIARTKERVDELDAHIRALKDAKRRLEAEEKIEKRAREGAPPGGDPAKPIPPPDEPSPD